eukprot:scaffold102208_cov16-Tisochrysis_lutea.AAC.2
MDKGSLTISTEAKGKATVFQVYMLSGEREGNSSQEKAASQQHYRHTGVQAKGKATAFQIYKLAEKQGKSITSTSSIIVPMLELAHMRARLHPHPHPHTLGLASVRKDTSRPKAGAAASQESWCMQPS